MLKGDKQAQKGVRGQEGKNIRSRTGKDEVNAQENGE